ncbi:MAG: prenyltransferase/squalene oxidase repeat-containing protein, partial [Patescibacteria group bacterium]
MKTQKISFKNSGIIILAALILAAPFGVSAATIHLRMETAGESLFNGDISVSPCKESPDAETETLNAKCAIEQSGLLNNFSYWGSDAFLNSIGTYENNKDGNGIYWSYFLNLDYGMLALNKQILSENDSLLLVYDTNPLKIETSTTTPTVGSEVEIKVYQFGLDADWNPVWSPSAGSKVLVDGAENEAADGGYKFTAATTTPLTVYGKKPGFLDSPAIVISGHEAPAEEPVPEVVPINSGINGGGGYFLPLEKAFDLGKAIEFLAKNQKEDGSFASPMITDWAAIAFSAYGPGENLEKIKSYYQGASDSGFGLTDYVRRAMALMALNINPYNGLKIDYIKKITSQFDGVQFGDPDYNNDDIFSLLVLENAGFGAGDEIIAKDVNYILSGQDASGSFGGVDLTAAAIQALRPLSQDAKIGEAIAKAKSYLAASQKEDGGFGNSFSTSWVLMAINALGEDAGGWAKNGSDPKDFLAALQAADGGLEKEDAPLDTRIWATAYAVPAALGKDWNSLMNDFSKVEGVKNEIPAGESVNEEKIEEGGKDKEKIEEFVKDDKDDSEKNADKNVNEEKKNEDQASEEKGEVLGVKV